MSFLTKKKKIIHNTSGHLFYFHWDYGFSAYEGSMGSIIDEKINRMCVKINCLQFFGRKKLEKGACWCLFILTATLEQMFLCGAHNLMTIFVAQSMTPVGHG